MEITLTQSGALYLAQHQNTKDRRRYFQHMRIAALSQRADVRTLRSITYLPLRNKDNGN